MTSSIDWTHKNIKIVDVRKLNKLYVLKIDCSSSDFDFPLFVKDVIFEERLKSYFLKDMNLIKREDILSVNWNMYITKGYYIKVSENGEIQKFNIDPNKWYVSYLEIDGPLGTFSSIHREKELTLKNKNNEKN